MGSVEFTTQSSESNDEVEIHKTLNTNLDKDSNTHGSFTRDALDTNNNETNKKEKRKKVLKRILKILLYQCGFLVVFLLVFFSQGISLLLKYRRSFGNKAPIPFSPVHGVVAVFNDSVEIEAVRDGGSSVLTTLDDDNRNEELQRYSSDSCSRHFIQMR